MAAIDTIVLHYSATYEDQDIGAAEIDVWHRARGFSPYVRADGQRGHVGYHHVVRLDGRVEAARPEHVTGCHVRGQNTGKLGVCTIGGLRRATGPAAGADTRTRAQVEALVWLVRGILARHPGVRRILGHRDLAATQCPGYDAAAWWAAVSGAAVAPAPAPAAAPAVSWPLLRKGSRGAQVAALQGALAVLGFAPGPADGVFGPRTLAAVRAFQSAARVIADGIVGPVTWAEIARFRRIPA